MIGEYLQTKKCPLLDLDMSSNSIGPRGACDVATALQSNAKLVTLRLSGNNVGNTGASALALVLTWNPDSGVRSLDLAGDKMELSDSCFKHFVRLLENRTVRLELGSSRPAKVTAKLWEEVQKLNHPLRSTVPKRGSLQAVLGLYEGTGEQSRMLKRGITEAQKAELQEIVASLERILKGKDFDASILEVGAGASGGSLFQPARASTVEDSLPSHALANLGTWYSTPQSLPIPT